ncbi:MAG: hypothetical protein ACRYFS_07265 [Janthinobacterium lividum]
MNTRFSLTFAALAVFGLAAAHPAAAQSTIVLQNGVFASAGNSNDVYNFTSNLGDMNTAPSYSFGNHTQGFNSGIYINDGSVYQLLGTTGAAGETLTLNGLVGNFGTPPPGPSVLEFTTAAPTPSDSLATGSVLASETVTPPGAGDNEPFAPLTFTTTVANQNIYLILGGPAGAFSQQVNYQNFSLTDTPAAVPEASTTVSFGLLLMLGLGGIVVAARKKKIAA